jgi:hypothetical protein
MAIVDDFSGIAAELRRIKKERSRTENGRGDAPMPDWAAPSLDPRHPMRRTAAGDFLYRRLTRQRRRTNKTDAPG